ncbi:DUF3718 domain-containing protein [Aliiglaciecola sp. NS0011-25]|uniref:DUF3718 domain-containing protein n=2 Tax=Alteromonadaceae TaxID=72275 RepID=UPI00333F3612
MMNTLTKVIATAALTLASIGVVNASNVVVPADNYVTSNLCAVATEGSKIKMSQAIKKSGLSKRYVATKVTCNDLQFMTFIEQYGSNANDMNDFLTGGKYSNTTDMAAVTSHKSL